jgi:hypothetical protein
MSRVIGVILGTALLLLSANSGRDRFGKYKAVEAYEVQPGVLMMPRYSADGQVCEIGLQREQYSAGTLEPRASLSREDIDRVFDKLVPADERGPKSAEPPLDTLITQSSHTLRIRTDYENVLLKIVYEVLPSSNSDDTNVGDNVAIIQWKNRKCQ